MPQMSPMPWIFLLVLSLITLIMITSMIYFNSNKNLHLLKKHMYKPLTLKW